MEICILKSASSDVYFQQNLKLLGKPIGEEVEMRYRSRWVSPELLSDGSALRDRHCRGLLIFCDPPSYHCIPVRELEIFNADTTEHALTIFARVGSYFDPSRAPQWAREFSALNPDAGRPARGRFVMPLVGQQPCPVVHAEHEQRAWRAVVDELVKGSRYRNCFFFYRKGLLNEEGEEVPAPTLQAGKKYELRVLSYNHHLPEDTRDNSRIRVITDESIAVASPSESVGVPKHNDLAIAVRPISPGRSRLEVSVSGQGNLTARVELSITCVPPQPEPMLAVAETPRTHRMRLWDGYLVLQRSAPTEHNLLLHFLEECFTEGEKQEPRVAEQIVNLLGVLKRFEDCAAFVDQLPEESVRLMSSEARTSALFAVCRSRSVLPLMQDLCDISDSAVADRFGAMVAELPARSAATLILSVLRADCDGAVLIDESSLCQLLTMPNVLDGFDTIDQVRRAVDWFRGREFAPECYRFLTECFGRLSLGVGLLEDALEMGAKSDGAGLTSIVLALLDAYLSSGDGDHALQLLRREGRRISAEDYPYLLAEAARLAKSESRALAYLDAAGAAQDCADFSAAASYLEQAHRASPSDGTVDTAQRIDRQREQLQLQVAAYQDQISDEFGWERALRRAKHFCRGKGLALVGGERAPGWLGQMKDEVEAKEVRAFLKPRSKGIKDLDALFSGIADHTYAVVVKREWCNHQDEIHRKCKDADALWVPARGEWKSIVCAIARRAGDREQKA